MTAGIKPKHTKKRVNKDTRIIGANLRNMRRASGLSLEEIAAILEITHQQVQKYESGQNRFPVEKLFRLRQFYGVPYDFFFEGIGPAAREEENSGRDLFVRLVSIRDQELRKKAEDILAILLG